MTLGPYSGMQVDTGSTNLTVNCTAGSANYTVGLSGGNSGVTTARTMKSGTVVLNYSLSRDAARTQNWGNVAGTDTYAGNGATASVSVPIYPRIAAGQLVAPGTYTDTVSTASKSFTVSATILPSCSISTSAMSFGIYAGTVLDSTSTITLTCSNTTSYTVSLNQGVATGATTSARQMTRSGATTLNYTLSSDAARTANWGNTAGGDTVAGTGSGNSQTLTIYGRVPAGQRVMPGSYADTIVATITY
ncbi:Csu type fimbrial protein [Glacieibacterium megasporae]|uniref:Csu type fimbrial protein n=1 Tax=Glacieibacterium megasporae TaxID=2835787 RepID=UPI0021067937|nr:spore coat protein U domain-containing protein [Polymorphobacter megasporae]